MTDEEMDYGGGACGSSDDARAGRTFDVES